MEIDIPTHKSKFYCLLGQKTGLSWLKPSLDQDWSKDWKRLQADLVFLGPGLVFFGFRKYLDLSQSQPCFFGPKNQTGPDFQALIFSIVQGALPAHLNITLPVINTNIAERHYVGLPLRYKYQ